MIGSAIAGTDYTYDVRGNILKVADLASLGTLQWEYNYDGDILTQAEQSRRIGSITYNFAHDSLGRMTFDGLNGLNIEYNILNLPKKIGNSDSTLVNYSYLADGTKISSLTQLGEGLVFRGPFTYRRASDGTLTLESAVCDEGRLTPERALLYVRDHLGSVRAVVDGNSAEILEASKYGVYGSRNELASAGTFPGLSFRDHFTGKEDQKPDFGIPYSDHGARLYAPSLRRWMIPDPLSEKYYGISPYAYCADNPLNAVDPDGRSVHTNKDGKVIVVFEDDNMGIYRHWNDNSTKESLTELHRHYSPNVGGEYMGEYWQLLQLILDMDYTIPAQTTCSLQELL